MQPEEGCLKERFTRVITSQAPPSQKSVAAGSGRSSSVSITTEPSAALLVSPSFVCVALHRVRCVRLSLICREDLEGDLTVKECAACGLASATGGKACLEASIWQDIPSTPQNLAIL